MAHIKKIEVEGVNLYSGFWYVIRREPDRVIFRNKRDQTIILKPEILEKLKIVKRKIKTL